MDFLDLVETIDARDGAVDKLLSEDGYSRIKARTDPRWKEKVVRFTDLLREVQAGSHRARATLIEAAQSTSDFPNLFGDVIQRQLLGYYMATTPTYRNYCRVGEVPDFRTVKRFAVDGGEGVLSTVAELAEYPEAALSDTPYSYAVAKYGRRLGFSWESFLNDDLGAFARTPERLARAASRTEEKLATGLFVDANGPHASLYTSGNKNIVNSANGAASNNPVLSVQALQDALKVVANLKDADGEPIFIETVQLVVPPALEIVAQNILHAAQLRINAASGGGTTDDFLYVQNWMQSRMKLSVNYYIPVVATTNGSTSWFLFADPGVGRPALEVGFLRGNQQPALFRKASNAERIGGGGSAVGEEGDFDTDSLLYKVRHVVGATRLDPKATVASNGSGS